ncbi:TetR/AcrR family transcriptional regulator [Desulfosporosinus sp. Sb-LF]|uniref:TetR/AcrR family transcriptional regulator n=1 Tax=Desulfosporosinus sp. Sb-LF TaxID=2560027 RepID=UPI00107F8A05|nr:TetR/AcrR family transcriptional regulator [Desulfosporosinus sp. Sb-LF]TGE31422.1 TetR family transcriptional regulator [Desulfosporosinus sp. Sb-LF]
MLADKEKAIFQAAMQIFAAEGFERATMDHIAQQAKVAKGTLFYRYKSKEDLFVSMIQSAVNQFLDTARAAITEIKEPIARLKKTIEIQTQLSFEYPEFAKLLLSEVWGKQDRQREFRAVLQTYLTFLEEIIHTGIDAGEIRPTDPTLLASSIFGMTAAASLHILLSEKPVDLTQTVAEIQDYWLKGISMP